MDKTRKLRPLWFCTIALLIGFAFTNAHAQLTDQTQTTPHVPGSAIVKSLKEQIGTGQGNKLTPGSSIYLIKRDPARSIRRGRQLFQRKFTANQGLGPRVNADSSGDIQNDAILGAGLVDSCAGCHGRPRGAAGFGGDVVTRPDSRDAPHLFGLGLIEQLGDEITIDLRKIRDRAVAMARASGRFVRLSLISKGIKFGHIIGLPDGSVKSSQVEGVDSDLRIRPFFHHGGTVSIREFIVGAFKGEMGLESPDPILCAATAPRIPVLTVSPSGMVFDPSQDSIERPPVCDRRDDADLDGVVNEIDPALVDHMEFYLLNYFKPGRYKITKEAEEGLKRMKEIGCLKCHVQNLTIKHDRRVADVETQYDEEKGIFNQLFATVTGLFHVFDDGQDYPQLLPKGDSFVVKNVFTDLKRHDLGRKFHERQYDGTFTTEFVTEPLWGVGSTAPYGHDGRSINLMEVILRHGGEAQESRDEFKRLSKPQKRSIVEFLNTLVLFPPDDTASNLNEGDPDGNPQTEHGSIRLPALFQIPEEGDE